MIQNLHISETLQFTLHRNPLFALLVGGRQCLKYILASYIITK